MRQLLDDSKYIRALALTISPPERVNKWNALKSIFINDKIFINQQLRKCSKSYYVYPELDDNGRLHYHGTIMVQDMVKWKKSVLPSFKRVLGFTKVKTIVDEPNEKKWHEYCSKEWELTQEILGLDDLEIIRYEVKPVKQANIYDYNNKLIGYGFLEIEPCDDDSTEEIWELVMDVKYPKCEESCDEETSLSQGTIAPGTTIETSSACR